MVVMQRLRSRRRQRGASVLVVFLVITMLTGIGIFAARSATLATTVAGSSKQLAQTRYITEYAIMHAAAALARNPQMYIDQMPGYVQVANDRKCMCFDQVPNATCYPLLVPAIEAETGMPLIVPADAANGVPGGLGAASIEVDFSIDLSDFAPAAPPVAGESLNANSPVKVGYRSITLTAAAQLRPVSAPADLLKNLAVSASMQRWRSHVIVGPVHDPPPQPPAP